MSVPSSILEATVNSQTDSSASVCGVEHVLLCGSTDTTNSRIFLSSCDNLNISFSYSIVGKLVILLLFGRYMHSLKIS